MTAAIDDIVSGAVSLNGLGGSRQLTRLRVCADCFDRVRERDLLCRRNSRRHTAAVG